MPISIQRPDKGTLTLVQCQNLMSRVLIYKAKQIVIKFVAKFLKYRMLFKDILTFSGLDYRDA